MNKINIRDAHALLLNQKGYVVERFKYVEIARIYLQTHGWIEQDQDGKILWVKKSSFGNRRKRASGKRVRIVSVNAEAVN